MIAATRAVSPEDEDRRARVSGSLISVMSTNAIFLAAYFEILSSSVTHVPESAAEVLIRRRLVSGLTALSMVGTASPRFEMLKRAAR